MNGKMYFKAWLRFAQQLDWSPAQRGLSSLIAFEALRAAVAKARAQPLG